MFCREIKGCQSFILKCLKSLTRLYKATQNKPNNIFLNDHRTKNSFGRTCASEFLWLQDTLAQLAVFYTQKAQRNARLQMFFLPAKAYFIVLKLTSLSVFWNRLFFQFKYLSAGPTLFQIPQITHAWRPHASLPNPVRLYSDQIRSCADYCRFVEQCGGVNTFTYAN